MKTAIKGIDVTFWNPRTRHLRGLPIAPRMRNFGDLLGPWVVERMLQANGIRKNAPTRRDLVTVGTIMYLAPDLATVWGTGTRDTVARSRYQFRQLDVRAVRGPGTRDLLADLGVRAPAIYGDPGLLTPVLDPSLRALEKVHDVVYVPNYADYEAWRATGVSVLVNPRAPLERVLRTIASSKAVVASSLHALILADAFGIPSVRVSSGVEGDFKYHDYARGAARPLHAPSKSPVGAVSALEAAPAPIDTSELLAAFPLDLWHTPANGITA